jgi:alpha-tubulin suppressor-like RCC1 family protein
LAAAYRWTGLLLLAAAASVNAQVLFDYDLPGNLTAQSNVVAVAPPQFQQLSPQYVVAQSNGLFSVSVPVTGVGPFTYQWLFNGNPLAGATNYSFTLSNTAAGNLGGYQLVVSNAAGVVTSAVVNVSFDSDQLGLPDAWQIAYFGHIHVDPNADPDGDGVSNYQEYLDGTDPTNPNSVRPRLNLSAATGGSVVVTPLKSEYQLGDTVQIMAVPNMGASFSAWVGTNWAPIGGGITNTNATFSIVMNSTKSLTAQFGHGLPLSQVLDASNLVWTTGGDSVWFGQTNISYDGVSAAQSGTTLIGQQSWLQTVADYTNLVSLGFHWSVSSESGVNFLSLYVNGNLAGRISGGNGQVTWQTGQLYLPPGTNVLRWVYAQNQPDTDYGFIDLDTGWLDQVKIAPLAFPPGGNAVVAWGNNGNGQANVPQGLTNVLGIAAGLYHSMALKNDGTVVAWGYNSDGETNVPASVSNVVSVASGSYHNLAVKSDGTVAAWGYNGYGQTNVPGGLSNVVAVAGGGYHSLALNRNGNVVAWGNNVNGQTNVPAGLSNVVAIAGGGYHSLALRSDGTVTAWGYNNYGQTNVPALSNVVAVAAGLYHSLALKSDGTVAAWGYNGYGQTNLPPGLSNVVAIAAGYYYNLALKTDGSLVGWGDNSYGQTVAPQGLSNLVAIAAGGYHAVAVVSDGSPYIPRQPPNLTVYSGVDALLSVGASGTQPLAYQWQYGGANIAGATNPVMVLYNVQTTNSGIYNVVVTNSNGSVTSSNAVLTVINAAPMITSQPSDEDLPFGQNALFSVSVIGSLPVTYQWQFNGTNIAGATNATLSLSNLLAYNAGSYRVVLSNAYGVTISSNAAYVPVSSLVVSWGDNANRQTNVPAGLTNVLALAGGLYHSVALKNDGTAVAWGYNGDGETNVPASVSNAVSVASGWYHNLALKSNGTIGAWGYNGYGQSSVPAGLSNVVAVAGGGYHSLALNSNGNVVAWGNNGNGQTNVPAGLNNVVAVAAGGYHSLALRSDGTVVAWGYNAYGQTNVPALSNVVAIAAGIYHSLALSSDGTVTAWGYNGYGQTNVPPGLSNVVAIAAGAYYNLALKTDGSLVGWGDNSYGQNIFPPGLTNLAAIAAGGYHAVAVVGDGSPHIPRQPPYLMVYSGANASLTVGASGIQPLAYQWQYGGVNIAGATNPVMVLYNVQTANSGIYNVVVTNSNGSVTSSNGVLTVINAAPMIASQPLDEDLPFGQNALFSVSVIGSLPVTYQWQFDGTNIAGATNATLILSNLLAYNAGSYRVVLSNAYGVTISSNAAYVPVSSLVVSWGDNANGQTNVPAGLTNVLALAGGLYHSVALKNDGTVVAWGYNNDGETNVPASVSNVVSVASGWYHNLALKSDGTVVGWGNNGNGQTNVPAGLSNVIAVAGGGYHSLALNSNGNVVAWGYDGYGQTNVPAGLSNVVAIAGGGYHSLALGSDGTVTAWGYNGFGQTNVPALSNVVAVAAGLYHSLALKSDGTVAAWGYDGYGQTDAPPGLSNVVAIAAGYDYNLALKNDGTLVGWGDNSFGQTNTPVLINTAAIAAGGYHGLALIGDGSPFIPIQPSSVIAYSGTTAELFVAALGASPLSYQWSFDGTNITDATNAVLLLPNVQMSSSGFYSAIVSNALGSVTSSNATLTVVDSRPIITSQPSDVALQPGQTALVQVAATGSAPLNYRWQKNGLALSDGGNILGSSSASLAISNFSEADQAGYSVVVSNAFGVVTSSNAVLSITLVQNGGFESGTLAGWTQSGDTDFTSLSSDTNYAHSGNYGLQTGPTGSLGYISQVIPTVSGQSYLLSFWLYSPGGSPTEFLVSWNGQTLFDQTNLPAFGWTNLEFTVSATTTNATLEFGFQNDPDYFGLDDISLAAVPGQPRLAVGGFSNGAFHLLVFGQVGQSYTVEGSTDLMNWVPITNFIATNVPAGFSDPAAASSFARRFYRVVIP